MADYVELALRSGARIVGACCGSTPDHIAAIREAVDRFDGGDRPKVEDIQRLLDASIPGENVIGRTRTGRRG